MIPYLVRESANPAIDHFARFFSTIFPAVSLGHISYQEASSAERDLLFCYLNTRDATTAALGLADHGKTVFLLEDTLRHCQYDLGGVLEPVEGIVTITPNGYQILTRNGVEDFKKVLERYV